VKIIRLICLTFLLMLTSCSLLAQTPPDSVVQMAITQQLMQSQQSIAQDLGLELPTVPTANFKLESVNISNRQKINDPNLLANPNVTEAYKVSGTFFARLLDSNDRNGNQDTPFELYLGTDTADESDVETWFLMRP